MTNPSTGSLVKTLLDGDQAGAMEETGKLRKAGVGCEGIITEGIEAAMTLLDAKCTVEQFNLLGSWSPDGP